MNFWMYALRRNKAVAVLFFSLILTLKTLDLSAASIPNPPYSRTQLGHWLKKAWEGYKHNFIRSNGQVVRPENGYDTTSEGQALAMLIAVNMNDKCIFDKSFNWAEKNLSRWHPGSESYGGQDNLLASHWQPLGGVQANGWLPSAGADEDYAYALLLAYEKWGKEKYRCKALAVLEDILAKETYAQADQNLLFLKPSTWGESHVYERQGIYINLSYLSPAWYRKFNVYLPDNRWQMLIEGSYHLIQRGTDFILDLANETEYSGVGLLPEWAFVDDSGFVYSTGTTPFPSTTENNFDMPTSGPDASKLAWRIYNDYKNTDGMDTRAQSYLNSLKTFYQHIFNMGGRIFDAYFYTGQPSFTYTSPGVAGMALLHASLSPMLNLNSQMNLVQTALAYTLKSAAINPPMNTQFSGPDFFQESKKSGIFVTVQDIPRLYNNTLSLLSLLSAYQTP